MSVAGLRTWIEGDISRIRLDQPERLNPIGSAQWVHLREHLARSEAQQGVRAVVIDAVGRYFCAGNDLREIGALADPAAAAQYFLQVQLPTLRALVASPLPVVCVVQADSAGGGIELALCCDVVIAAASARFSLPEAQVGLFATTVLAPVPTALSRHGLQRLAFTGEPVGADVARELGLVHQVVADGDLPEAVEHALSRLRRASPAALAATKASLNAALLSTGFPRMRAALQHLAEELLFTADAQEGLAAFRERREPQWQPVVPRAIPQPAGGLS